MVLNITTLNDSNIKDYANTMENKQRQLIAFLADWCGHCQTFKPEWERFKNIIQKDNENMRNGVSLKYPYDGEIVTASDKTMMGLPCKDKPGGFPTVSIYEGTNLLENYSGERNAESLLEYIRKKFPKNITTTNKDGITQEIASIGDGINTPKIDIKKTTHVLLNNKKMPKNQLKTTPKKKATPKNKATYKKNTTLKKKATPKKKKSAQKGKGKKTMKKYRKGKKKKRSGRR